MEKKREKMKEKKKEEKMMEKKKKKKEKEKGNSRIFFKNASCKRPGKNDSKRESQKTNDNHTTSTGFTKASRPVSKRQPGKCKPNETRW